MSYAARQRRSVSFVKPEMSMKANEPSTRMCRSSPWVGRQSLSSAGTYGSMSTACTSGTAPDPRDSSRRDRTSPYSPQPMIKVVLDRVPPVRRRPRVT